MQYLTNSKIILKPHFFKIFSQLLLSLQERYGCNSFNCKSINISEEGCDLTDYLIDDSMQHPILHVASIDNQYTSEKELDITTFSIKQLKKLEISQLKSFEASWLIRNLIKKELMDPSDEIFVVFPSREHVSLILYLEFKKDDVI